MAVKLAATAEAERELLLGLNFVPETFKAFWRANPKMMTAENIRGVIRQQWPAELAALEAKALEAAKPKAVAAAPHPVAPKASSVDADAFVAQVRAESDRQARARAEQQDAISRAMGVGAYAQDAKRTTTYDPLTGIQTFGVGVAR